MQNPRRQMPFQDRDVLPKIAGKGITIFAFILDVILNNKSPLDMKI